MIEFISHMSIFWLAWYNSGGIWLNTNQVIEYLNSRMEVWAYSKVN